MGKGGEDAAAAFEGGSASDCSLAGIMCVALICA